MTTPLQEFQQTGQLPFVGRTMEVERIVEFWHATPEAQLLRCALVVAEAGVGKSRLLEEVLARIEAAGGAAVHVKLYPESGNSLAQLLARALWQSSAGQDLLRTQPEESLPSAIAALRRLCRLRPTIVIIEDIHLLEADAVADLSAFVDALADETLSVLALGRPSPAHALAAIERVLVDRIELRGLAREDIALMWRALFGADADATTLERLCTATAGNALAVRSGIRAAVEMGMSSAGGGAIASGAGGAQFAARLARSVELLSAGMVSHLTADELEGARKLALLGEVFAGESAGALIEDAEALIAALTRKGILTTATTDVAPVVAASEVDRFLIPHYRYPVSARPLHAFAHTLLHRHLADHAPAHATGLLDVIGGDLPLYSLFPLHTVAPHVTGGGALLEKAALRVVNVCYTLNKTAGWREIDGLIRIVEQLVAAFEEGLSEDARVLWRARILELELACNYRTKSRDVQQRITEELLAVTTTMQTAELAPYRLVALNWFLNSIARYDYSRMPWAEAELERLLARFPEIRLTARHAYYLGMLVDTARLNDDHALVRSALERARRLLDEPNIDEDLRERIVTRIFTSALTVFATPEELAEREELLQRLLGSPRLLSAEVGPDVNNFLMQTGRFDTLIEVAGRLIPVFREHGGLYNAFIAHLNRTLAAIGFGAEPASLEAPLKAQLDEILSAARGNASYYLGMGLAMYSMLRCDMAPAERMLADHTPNRETWNPCMPLLFALGRGDYAAAAELTVEARPIAALEDEAVEPMGMLIRAAAGSADTDSAVDAGSFEAALPGIDAWLRRPPLRIWNLLLFDAAARMAGRVAERYPTAAPVLDAALREGLRVRLEWLAERGLFGFMRPMIAEFRALLDEADAAAWSARTDALEAARRPGETQQHGRVRIAMLGTIRAALPGREFESLRGSRVRLVLGLMVADQMIGHTLTHREFVQIAGGGADGEDLDLARKKRNMTIVRLREALGQDAILTDGPTPALNLARVQVDILDADALIRRTLAALREGALVRAQPLLLEALSIARGDVPFPTLYDSFFEAAREDFEFRLHAAIVDVARALLREGDRAGAEMILQRGFEAMPDDEEITEMLRDTLRSMGRRVEAERILRRAKEAAGV